MITMEISEQNRLLFIQNKSFKIKNIMTNRILSLFFILTVFSITWTSCDKDDNPTPDPDPEKTTLEFHFDYVVNGDALVIDDVYTLDGVAVSFNVANFYVGGLRLMNEAGEMTMLEDLYLLVKPDQTEFDLGEITSDHYHMTRFNVGILADDNDQSEDDFTMRDGNVDPLGMQLPSMHWGWNAGYRFMRVDGLVDADGDGTPESAMEFHIGTDNLLTEAMVMIHKEVEAEKTNIVEIQVDLAKLFTDIDLSTDNITHTGDGLELAQKVAANIPSAFSKK